MKTIITRLKRINGQISGLVKMMEEGDDCEKIIIQFQAAKAALGSAFAEALHINLEQCLMKKDPEKMKKIIKLLA